MRPSSQARVHERHRIRALRHALQPRAQGCGELLAHPPHHRSPCNGPPLLLLIESGQPRVPPRCQQALRPSGQSVTHKDQGLCPHLQQG
eukprot:scaffold34601_cov45-Phaeocystis_antarctica.AAC.2